MNPYFRKAVSKFLAGTLSVIMLASTVSAETWYVENGDITVIATASGQTVTQNSKTHQETTDTVITNKNTAVASSSSITIKSQGNAQAQVTLKDVNLNKSVSAKGTAVDISDASNVQISLEGKNTVSAANNTAAVHVAEGDLTITSQTSGSLDAKSTGFDLDGSSGYTYDSPAAIGTNHAEALSGSITIDGNAQVNAVTDGIKNGNVGANGDGAAIGTGDDGPMAGSIHIGENAKVNAFSKSNGAGIGAGENAAIEETGSITIDGNAEVTAASNVNGAGIGAGVGCDMDGSINIGGHADVTANSNFDGTGIGSGRDGDMGGKITIDGNAQVTANSKYDGAGIGAGENGKITESGSISIDGSTKVNAASKDEGAGIGGGSHGIMAGKITIDGSAEVTASSNDDGAGIGAGYNADVKESGLISIGGNSTVTATCQTDGAGIGAGDASGDSNNGHMRGTILIGGNSKVQATSLRGGAGIGGGRHRDLFGTIHITDSADVLAKGMPHNAAIGGHWLEPGAKILIDGNANVQAISQNAAAIGSGIGGYIEKDTVIRIGGHAKVIAMTGSQSAAIGAQTVTSPVDGATNNADFGGIIEILDNANIVTGVLDDNGNPVKNVPGMIGGGGAADKDLAHLNERENHGSIVLSNGAVINGILCSSYEEVNQWVRVPTDKNGLPLDLTFIPYVEVEDVPSQSNPEKEAAEPQGLLLYWVTADGKPLAAESLTENGVLTVTVPEKDAELNMTAGGLALLKAMGIKTLVFKTADQSSTVKLQDLIDLNAASLQLKHEGGKAILLADGKEVKDLLA